jgi:hypothetical protein
MHEIHILFILIMQFEFFQNVIIKVNVKKAKLNLKSEQNYL